MITKERLLSGLEELIYVEEGLITLFTSFTKSLVKHTEGVPEDKAKEMDRMLTRLHTDSTRHKKIIDDMVLKIEEAAKNEY